MEDGLFQLLFILMIIIASVVDAVARSRKKRGRIEEMEREEDEELHREIEAEGAPGPRTPRTEEPARAGRTPAGREVQGPSAGREGSPTGRDGPPTGPEALPEGGRSLESEEGEGTADRMVPPDLWAILTGQAPPGPPGPQPPTPGGPTRPEEPSRWERMEVPGEKRPKPDPEISRSPSPPSPRERTRRREEVPSPRAARPGSPAPERPVRIQPEELDDVFGTLDEPWDAISDIAAGEISDDGESLVEAPGVEPGPKKPRRTRPASRYTELLGSGDPNDLRKAVVLREILGPPAGLRRSEGPWNEQT